MCFYDVAEGDIFAEEDDDDDNDNDDDIQHKQNIIEAKKRVGIYSLSARREKEGKDNRRRRQKMM